MSNKKIKIAFTLAEVLITLGIIGVVSAMTMQIIKNIRNAHTATALRKSYSILAQATEMVAQDLGVDVKDWEYTHHGESDNSKTDLILDSYNKVLKYNEVCNQYNRNCSNGIKNRIASVNGSYKKINGDKENNYDTYWLARVYEMNDGTIISIIPSRGYYWIRWDILQVFKGKMLFTVDLNGYAKPNQAGKDLFYFVIDDTNKLVPAYGDDCTKDSAGYGCARRIMNNNWKIDY